MTSDAFSQRQLRAVLRFVGERTGLVFPEDRMAGAAATIAHVARRREVGDGGRFLERLAADKRLFDELVAELTVGETYFFREPAQFAFVRERVLPELCSRRGSDEVLRVWSAGCASGEEPYSLAILCDEEGFAERTQIVGTDISRAALAKARRGVYREWSLRGVSAETVRRHLRRDGENYLLDERIKGRVEFRPLNLAEGLQPGPPPNAGEDAESSTSAWHAGGPYDLIFCRNVLIYFDAATVAAVGRRLFEALAPGGWLVTASSDPPIGDLAAWETVVEPSAIAFRRPTGGRAGGAAIAAGPAPQDSTEAAAVIPEGTAESNSASPPATISAQPDTPKSSVADGDLCGDSAACAARVRELSNRDRCEAARFCEAATVRHPLSAELHYLRAVLLVERDRPREAAPAVRRAIYLDRSLAVAHFTLGTILERCGDVVGACRAYRNAREAAAAFPAGVALPLSDGECGDELAAAADRRLQALGSTRPRVER